VKSPPAAYGWLAVVGSVVTVPSPQVHRQPVMVEPGPAVEAEPFTEQVSSAQVAVKLACGALGSGVQMSRMGEAVALLAIGGRP